MKHTFVNFSNNESKKHYREAERLWIAGKKKGEIIDIIRSIQRRESNLRRGYDV